MKNLLKKIAAATMAFTLIGAGNVITHTTAPQASNTLSAKAHYYCGSTSYHTRDYKLGKSSEKVGNKVYLYQGYKCDCGYCWRVIVSVHSA